MAKQFKPKTSGITVNDTDEEVITNKEATEGVVENPVETVENSVSDTTEKETEPTDNDGVVANPDIEQKPAVKNVKILPKQNHTCSIGGTRYCLKKGVQTNVPVGVKEILNRAGLLNPL